MYHYLNACVIAEHLDILPKIEQVKSVYSDEGDIWHFHSPQFVPTSAIANPYHLARHEPRSTGVPGEATGMVSLIPHVTVGVWVRPSPGQL